MAHHLAWVSMSLRPNQFARRVLATLSRHGRSWYETRACALNLDTNESTYTYVQACNQLQVTLADQMVVDESSNEIDPTQVAANSDS